MKEAKERLQKRAERAHKRHMKSVEGMNDEEKREAATVHEAQLEADRLREDNAILTSMRSHEEVWMRSKTVID